MADRAARPTMLGERRPVRAPGATTGPASSLLAPMLTAVQRISAIDSIGSFPHDALEIVCELLQADRGVYSEVGAPGALSFAYQSPGRHYVGPSVSILLDVATDKAIGIVLVLSRREPLRAEERELVAVIEDALRRAHAMLRRVDRLARSLAVVAGGRRVALVLLDHDGELQLVDGSAAIVSRWFRPGSTLRGALTAWALRQRVQHDDVDADAAREADAFVAPSVDVVLRARWRGVRHAGDLIELEEQIFDGADLRCLGLSAREAEVLALLVVGADASTIAQRVGSRPGTVKKQIESIYRKLGVHTRRDAVTIAIDAMIGPSDQAHR